MSEDAKPKDATVDQTVMKITYEKRKLTFPSKADPPVKCCRCFPNSIDAKGFCGCCLFHHATGEQERMWDPDYDEAGPEDPPKDPEADPEE